MTPNRREFIQIPITREDGTTISNNAIRSVPITFISETTPLPNTTTNSNNGHINSKPQYTSMFHIGKINHFVNYFIYLRRSFTA